MNMESSNETLLSRILELAMQCALLLFLGHKIVVPYKVHTLSTTQFPVSGPSAIISNNYSPLSLSISRYNLHFIESLSAQSFQSIVFIASFGTKMPGLKNGVRKF